MDGGHWAIHSGLLLIDCGRGNCDGMKSPHLEVALTRPLESPNSGLVGDHWTARIAAGESRTRDGRIARSGQIRFGDRA